MHFLSSQSQDAPLLPSEEEEWTIFLLMVLLASSSHFFIPYDHLLSLSCSSLSFQSLSFILTDPFPLSRYPSTPFLATPPRNSLQNTRKTTKTMKSRAENSSPTSSPSSSPSHRSRSVNSPLSEPGSPPSPSSPSMLSVKEGGYGGVRRSPRIRMRNLQKSAKMKGAVKEEGQEAHLEGIAAKVVNL